MMDGYAVRSNDVSAGQTTLTVIEEVVAGRVPSRPIEAGQATRIMTGAPLPQGADAVVMIEKTRPAGESQVLVDGGPVRVGQNVLHQGQEMRRGERVLNPGMVVRPQELGLLAAVGRTSVLAYPRPQVAILVTGDELVTAEQTPGPGQIRNSNGPLLAAQVQRAGGIPRVLSIARDQPESLKDAIQDGLTDPILVLSGGVSAGKLDLVPGVLQEMGVRAHFHKVAMKPGKPVFFGTREAKLVFGLPGNPVSALVCFELFVRPAIRRLAGHADPGPFFVPAILAKDFLQTSDRPTYHPAQLHVSESGWTVEPVPWHGSPDLRSLGRANAFALFPAGNQLYPVGQTVSVLEVENDRAGQ
jgi:molybdopterin molybdotransferase